MKMEKSLWKFYFSYQSGNYRGSYQLGNYRGCQDKFVDSKTLAMYLMVRGKQKLEY